jgi:hypothetical protein
MLIAAATSTRLVRAAAFAPLAYGPLAEAGDSVRVSLRGALRPHSTITPIPVTIADVLEAEKVRTMHAVELSSHEACDITA